MQPHVSEPQDTIIEIHWWKELLSLSDIIELNEAFIALHVHELKMP